MINDSNTLPVQYNDRQFKKIYRSNKEQIAKSVIFDITHPLVSPDEAAVIEQAEGSIHVTTGSPNPFLSVSSISFNPSINNPEDIEMYLINSSIENQIDDGVLERGSRDVENPEDEF